MKFKEVFNRELKKFLKQHDSPLPLANDKAMVDLQTIIFSVAGAVIALIVAVIVLGNLDTATEGTISNTSAYYPLLATVNSYGVTAITLLAIGIIVAGAAAILYIIRGSF